MSVNRGVLQGFSDSPIINADENDDAADVDKLRRLLLTGEQQTVPTRVVVYGCCDVALLKALLGALHRLLLDSGDDGRSLLLFADLSILCLHSDNNQALVDGQTLPFGVDGARVPVYHIPLSSDFASAKATIGRYTVSGADLLIIGEGDESSGEVELDSSLQRAADLTDSSHLVLHRESLDDELPVIAAKHGLFLYGHCQLFDRHLAMFAQSPTRYIRMANVEADAKWMRTLQLLRGSGDAIRSWIDSCKRNLYVLVDRGIPRCAVLIQTVLNLESLQGVGIDDIDSIADRTGSTGIVVVLSLPRNEFYSAMIDFAVQILPAHIHQVCVIGPASQALDAVNFDSYIGDYSGYRRSSPRSSVLKEFFRGSDGIAVSFDLCGAQPDQDPLQIASRIANLAFDNTARSSGFDALLKLNEPIFLVGLAVQLPGGITNIHQFNNVLEVGSDVISLVPTQRPTLKSVSHMRGGFIDDAGYFDAPYFNIPASEARTLDPLHRHLLMSSVHAVTMAEICALNIPHGMGVFVGTFLNDYAHLLAASDLASKQHTLSVTGSPAMAPGRISYHFNSHGPSMHVNTAHSSGLVALHTAATHINAGHCNSALVSAANLQLSPKPLLEMATLGVLSASNHCQAFDADADGFVRSEGIISVVLASPATMPRCNKALAVLASCAVNHDGGGANLLVPSARAQELLYCAAQQNGGLVPDDIDHIDAHATGTNLGDKTECASISETFQSTNLTVTATKAQFGHPEAVSGLLNVLRIMVMQNQCRVTAQLHWKVMCCPKYAVVTRNLTLPIISSATNFKYCSTSSFGASGTNAHAIFSHNSAVESYETCHRNVGCYGSLRSCDVQLLSAKSPNSLEALHLLTKAHSAECKSTTLAVNPSSIQNQNFEHKLATISRSKQKFPPVLKRSSPHRSKLRKFAFMFSGHGSQYENMGKELYQTDALFARSMNECFDICASLLIPDMKDAIYPSNSRDCTRKLSSSVVAMDLLYKHLSISIVQHALSTWLMHLGITPDCLIGHSVGELYAASVSGIISLKSACLLVAARSRALARYKFSGDIIVMNTTEQMVSALIGKIKALYCVDASIATRNSAEQFGVAIENRQVVHEVINTLNFLGQRAMRLSDMPGPAHSLLLVPSAEDLRTVTQTIDFKLGSIPLISTLNANVMTQLDANYFCEQMVNPVCFEEAIGKALNFDCNSFLEVSGHPILLASAKTTAKRFGAANDDQMLFLPTLQKNSSDYFSLISSVCELHLAGATVKWSLLNGSTPTCSHVPIDYPFDTTPYWYDDQLSNAIESFVDSSLPITATPAYMHAVLGIDKVKQCLKEKLRDVVGLQTPALSADEGFMSLGLNSFKAMTFVAEIKDYYKLNSLSLTTLFQYSTINSLAAHIVQQKQVSQTQVKETHHAVMQPHRTDLQNAFAADDVFLHGSSCRLPKDSITRNSLWNALKAGNSGIGIIPAERVNLLQPDKHKDVPTLKTAGFLSQSLYWFDSLFFNISPKEAACIDPQHRMFYECAIEAIQLSGTDPLSLNATDVGVFAAIYAHDYYDEVIGITNASSLPRVVFGNVPSYMPGRLAYFLGLHGPSMAVDAACASSLVALNLAYQSVSGRESSTAVVGGVNLMLSPNNTLAMARYMAFSADCICRTFDADAGGTVRADGCVTVLIGKCDSTLPAVFGRIASASTMQDGASSQFTAPNGEAQSKLLLSSCRKAALSLQQLDVVEAHGTATKIGDPIEVNVFANILNNQSYTSNSGLTFGSAKAYLGHTEAAAGLAGLIKLISSMRNKSSISCAHFKVLNQNIDINSDSTICFPTIDEQFLAEGPIGIVSAFGATGTIANSIIQSNMNQHINLESTTTMPSMLQMSGKSVNALENNILSLNECLQQNPMATPCGIRYLRYRASCFGDTLGAMSESLKQQCMVPESTSAWNPNPREAFLFSGQGTLHTTVGKELYRRSAAFRTELAGLLSICDEILGAHSMVTLYEALYPQQGSQEQSKLLLTENLFYSAIGGVVIQIAIARYWIGCGVEPKMLIGHSLGQLSAAIIGGVYTDKEGIELAWARAAFGKKIVDKIRRDELNMKMALARAPDNVVKYLLQAYALDQSPNSLLEIAATNSPTALTLVGTQHSLIAVVNQLHHMGYSKSRQLEIIGPAHNSYMHKADKNEFLDFCRSTTPSVSQIPISCTVTGNVVTSFESDFWPLQLIAPVNYVNAISASIDYQIDRFIEIGPHPVLLPLTRECLAESLQNKLFMFSLSSRESSVSSMMHTFCKLYISGSNLSLNDLEPGQSGEFNDASPTYCFDRQKLWISREESTSSNIYHGNESSNCMQLPQPLLGISVSLGIPGFNDIGDLFQLTIAQQLSTAYLIDHAGFGTSLFPGAAYVEQALEYAAINQAKSSLFVQHISINRPMLIGKAFCTVFSSFRCNSGNQRDKVFTSYTNQLSQTQKWTMCASGIVSDRDSEHVMPNAKLCKPHHANGIQPNYDCLRQVGMHYGPFFQTAQMLWFEHNKIVSKVELSNAIVQTGYILHPALLDGVMHGLPFYLMHRWKSDLLPLIPVRFENIHVIKPFASITYGVIEFNLDNDTVLKDVNIALYSEDGSQLTYIENLAVQKISQDKLQSLTNQTVLHPAALDKQTISQELYTVTWVEIPLSPIEHNNTGTLWTGAIGSSMRKYLLRQTGKHIVSSLTERLNQPFGRVCILLRSHCSWNSRSNVELLLNIFNVLRLVEMSPIVHVNICVPTSIYYDVQLHPQLTPLHGLIRSFNKETSKMILKIIHFDSTVGLECLLCEISAANDTTNRREDIVSLRGSSRMALRLSLSERSHDDTHALTSHKAIEILDCNLVLKFIFTDGLKHYSNGVWFVGISGVVQQESNQEMQLGDLVMGVAPLGSLDLDLELISCCPASQKWSFLEAAFVAYKTNLSGVQDSKHSSTSWLLRNSLTFLELQCQFHMPLCYTESCSINDINQDKFPTSLSSAVAISRPFPSRVQWSSHQWCLLSGGLTGINRTVIDWLASAGVTSFACLSRSAASHHNGAYSVTSNSVDLSSKRSVDLVFRSFAKPSQLVAVIHGAAVLNDFLFKDLTWYRFSVVLKPKVLGGWNLHALTMHDHHIERFVVFSSIASTFGSIGQSNYAAANSFLESLIEHRRVIGLPAQSVAWGVWGEVGGVTDVLMEKVKLQGIVPLSTATALDMLSDTMMRDKAHTIAALIDWRSYKQLNPGLANFLSHVTMDDTIEPATVGQPATANIDNTAEAACEEYTEIGIKSIIYELLEKTLKCDRSKIDEHMGFAEMGLDSMMAIEFQNKLDLRFPTHQLSSTILFEHSSVASLSSYLYTSKKPLVLEVSEPSLAPKLMHDKDGFVAILGASCIFANSSTSFSYYWDMLMCGRDGIVKVPPDRSSLQKLGLDALGRPFKAGFIGRPVAAFDAIFFSTSPLEAKYVDPNQRIILETIWHAIEDCDIQLNRLQAAKTSVCVGIINCDYLQMVDHNSASNMMSLTGSSLAFAAGRPAYHFGFHGSNMVIDTACSTSLTAISIAFDNILSCRENYIIVATANLLLSQELVHGTWKDGLLASDSHCKSFDASADGLTRAEGITGLVLGGSKNESGKFSYGIIKGTAVNHDGASSGLTVPNGTAQEILLKKALQYSCLDATDVHYVECHGTGTYVGDPIECNALCTVFGENGLLHLGASKASVGHPEASAGMAGLLKALKAQNSTFIPQQLHFAVLNHKIHLQGNKMQVTAITEAFHGSSNILNGVSAFGLSGTNAHTIVSVAGVPEIDVDDITLYLNDYPYSILPIAAKSRHALIRLASEVETAMANGWYSSSDIACLTSSSREQFRHRTAIVGTQANMAPKLNSAIANEKFQTTSNHEGSIAFLFSGQVLSLCTMGKQLYSIGGEYKSQFDQCVSLINSICKTQLLKIYEHGIENPTCEAVSQPLQFAMEIALTQQWKTWGIEPNCVIGHSLGECAAAVSAGILSLADACKVVTAKGKLMDYCIGGSMVAVAAESDTILEVCKHNFDQVDLAAENSPQQSVLSGSREQLRQISAICATIGHRCSAIDVCVAFHSRQLCRAAPKLLAVTETLDFKRASIPFYCNLTGKSVASLGPNYWPEQVMSTVQFYPAAVQMLNDGVNTTIEVGPRSVLSSFLSQILRHMQNIDVLMLPSWKARQDEAQTMAESLASLFTAGYKPDFSAFYANCDTSCRQANMSRPYRIPHYQFVHQNHWAPMKDDIETSTPIAAHPLLGKVVANNAGFEAINTISLSARKFDYLMDHQVFKTVVFPGAAFVELFVTIVATHLTSASKDTFQVVLKQIQFVSVLELSPTADTTIITTLTNGILPAVQSVSIATKSQNCWHYHARAVFASTCDNMPQSAYTDSQTEHSSVIRQIYSGYEQIGISFGNAFQTVDSITINGLSAIVSVSTKQTTTGYIFHPTLLDGVFHGCSVPLMFKATEGEGDTVEMVNKQAFLPVYISEFRCTTAGCSSVIARSHWLDQSAYTSEGSFEMFNRGDDKLEVVAMASGCRVQAITKLQLERVLKTNKAESLAYQLSFERIDSAPIGDAAIFDKQWIVLSKNSRLSRAMQAAQLPASYISHRAGILCKSDTWQAFDWDELSNFVRLLALFSADQIAGVSYVSALNSSLGGRSQLNISAIASYQDDELRVQVYLAKAIVQLSLSFPLWFVAPFNLFCSSTSFAFEQLCQATSLGFSKAFGAECSHCNVTAVDYASCTSIDLLVVAMKKYCKTTEGLLLNRVLVLHKSELFGERITTSTDQDYKMGQLQPSLTNFSVRQSSGGEKFSSAVLPALDGNEVHCRVTYVSAHAMTEPLTVIFSGYTENSDTNCDSIVTIMPASNLASLYSLGSEQPRVGVPSNLTAGCSVVSLSTMYTKFNEYGNASNILLTWNLLVEEGHHHESMAYPTFVDIYACNSQSHSPANMAYRFPPVLLSTDNEDTSVATFTITGGLGGIGLELAKWIADRKKNIKIFLLSRRSTSSSEAIRAIAHIEESGSTAEIIQMDIAKRQNWTRFTACVPSDAPMRGIFQLAMVLDSGPVANLAWKQFHKVFAPKLLGTWYMHTTVTNQELAYFVLFSSMASAVGGVGESNYAASNAFIDQLAHARRAAGVCAQTLNWGGWSDVGLAVDLDSSRVGTSIMMNTQDGLSALEYALQQDKVQMILGYVGNWDDLVSRFTSFRDWAKHLLKQQKDELVPAEQKTSTDVSKKLKRHDKESTRKAVEHLLRDTLQLSDDHALDENEQFISMGMDSIMAVDFGNRLQQEFDGIENTSTTIFENNTIVRLCRYITKELHNIRLQPTVLRKSVTDSLRAVLQLPHNHEFDENEEFMTMGMDSMMAVDLGNKLEQCTGQQLSGTEIFEHNTVGKLCAFLSQSITSESNESAVSEEANPKKCQTSMTSIIKMRKPVAFSFSFPQQRIWYWNKVSQDAGKHTMIFTIMFNNKLNPTALHETLALMISKHGCLRMIPIEESHSIGLQTYLSHTENYHELSSELQNKCISHMNDGRWLQQSFDVFDCTGLLRSELVCNAASRNVRFYLNCHHLICDGWSCAIILSEMLDNYRLFLKSKQSPIPNQQATYCDFTMHQLQLIHGEHIEQQLGYWQKSLGGYQQLLWPTDRALSPIKSSLGVQLLFHLAASTSNKLRAQCQKAAVTPFTVAFSSLCLLIRNWCHQDDFLMGSASDNRTPETSGIVGYLANNMAIRVRINEKSTTDFVAIMQNVLFEAFKRKEVPYEHILANIDIRRDFHLSQLVQALFIMAPGHRNPDLGDEIAGVSLMTNNMVEFDQTWHLLDSDTGLHGKLKYVKAFNDIESMRTVVQHYQHILINALQHNVKISAEMCIFMQCTAERELNCQSNMPQLDMCKLHGVVLTRGLVMQGQLIPNSSARRLPKSGMQSMAELSFAEVNFAQHRGAALFKRHTLIHYNVTYPTVIALSRCNAKPTNFLHIIVGCIIAGYTVKLVNKQSAADTRLKFDVRSMPNILHRTRNASQKLSINNEISIIIVKNGHEVFLSSNLISKMSAHLIHSQFIPLYSRITIIFDTLELSTESLMYGAFSALLNGCCTVFSVGHNAAETVEAPADASLDFAMGSWMSVGALCIDMPQALKILRSCTERYQNNENVLFGGYANGRLMQYFTFGSSCHWHTSRSIASWTAQPNVGSVLPTASLAVLDKDSKPCQNGVPGELCEYGYGAMHDCQRMGIYAKTLPDSTVWHIANKRMLVSVNGLCVDLTAVECAIMSTKEIQTCAVICMGLKLIGYYVLNPHFGGSLSESRLQFNLCKSLPVSLIPSRLVRLNSLPVNDNGTFDRRLLSSVQLPQHGDLELTDVEQKLLLLWRSCFEINDLEIYENIFKRNVQKPITFWYEAAAAACAAIKESKLVCIEQEFDLSSIFNYPTVSLFYQHISSM